MEYLKIIKNNEKYDTWKDSDEAGYPHVVMYEKGHSEAPVKTVVYEKRTKKPSMFPIYLTSNDVSFSSGPGHVGEGGTLATYTFKTEKIDDEKYLSDYIFDFYISKLEPIYYEGELSYYEIPEKVTKQYPVYFNGCKIVCVGNSPMSNDVDKTEIMFDIEENLPPLHGYKFLYPLDTARVFWNENGIITLTVYVEKTIETIQFTIEDTFSPMVSAPEKTYTAEEGMTFADFCDSEYNIDGWFVTKYNDINVIKHQYNFYIYDGTGSPIDPSVIIEDNGIYRWGD